MPRPVDVLLRDHVAPALRERGFRRSGGTFRHVTPDGDVAIVTVRTWRLGQREIELHVDVGFTTAAWLASPANVRHQTAERADLGTAYGHWHRRVQDPSRGELELASLFQLDLADEVAVARLVGAVGEAADEALTRLGRWPEVPDGSGAGPGSSHPPAS